MRAVTGKELWVMQVMHTDLKSNIINTYWKNQLRKFLLWLNKSVLLLETVSSAFVSRPLCLDIPSVQQTPAQHESCNNYHLHITASKVPQICSPSHHHHQ
jgi:hypothetical protein